MTKKNELIPDESLSDLDDLDLDFGLGDEYSFEPKPSKDRNPVMAAAKGALSSFNLKTHSFNIIEQIAKHALPRAYGDAVDSAKGLKYDISNIYSDTTKNLQPTFGAIKTATKKALPFTSKFLPRKIAEKVKAFDVDDDDDEQRSYNDESSDYTQDDANAGEIKSTLQLVFGAQRIDQDLRERKALAIHDADKVIEQQTFEVSSSIQSSMASGIKRLVDYQDTVLDQYYKKSLELQYLHFFAARDLLSVTKASNSDHLAVLQDILKNTALPNEVKVATSEQFTSANKQRLIGYAQDSLRRRMGNLPKRVLDGIRESTRDFADTINGATDTARSMFGNSNDDFGSDFGIDDGGISGQLGEMAGSSVRDSLGKKTGKYLKTKLPSFLNWISPNLNDKVESFGQTLHGFVNYGPGKLKRAMDESEGKGWLGSLQNLIGQEYGVGEQVNHNLRADATEQVPWDLLSRRTLIEIIPGYLSRSLEELGNIYNILSGSTDKVDRLQYSTTHESFVKSDVIKNAANRQLKSTMGTSLKDNVKQIIDNIDPENTLTNDERIKLGVEISKKAGTGVDFHPKDYLELYSLGGELSEKVGDLVRQQFEVTSSFDWSTGKNVVRTGSSAAVKEKINTLNDKFINVRDNVGDYTDIINKYNETGEKEVLRSIGLIDEKTGQIDPEFRWKLVQELLGLENVDDFIKPGSKEVSPSSLLNLPPILPPAPTQESASDSLADSQFNLPPLVTDEEPSLRNLHENITDANLGSAVPPTSNTSVNDEISDEVQNSALDTLLNTSNSIINNINNRLLGNTNDGFIGPNKPLSNTLADNVRNKANELLDRHAEHIANENNFIGPNKPKGPMSEQVTDIVNQLSDRLTDVVNSNYAVLNNKYSIDNKLKQSKEKVSNKLNDAYDRHVSNANQNKISEGVKLIQNKKNDLQFKISENAIAVKSNYDNLTNSAFNNDGSNFDKFKSFGTNLPTLANNLPITNDISKVATDIANRVITQYDLHTSDTSKQIVNDISNMMVDKKNIIQHKTNNLFNDVKGKYADNVSYLKSKYNETEKPSILNLSNIDSDLPIANDIKEIKENIANLIDNLGKSTKVKAKGLRDRFLPNDLIDDDNQPSNKMGVIDILTSIKDSLINKTKSEGGIQSESLDTLINITKDYSVTSIALLERLVSGVENIQHISGDVVPGSMVGPNELRPKGFMGNAVAMAKWAPNKLFKGLKGFFNAEMALRKKVAPIRKNVFRLGSKLVSGLIPSLQTTTSMLSSVLGLAKYGLGTGVSLLAKIPGRAVKAAGTLTRLTGKAAKLAMAPARFIGKGMLGAGKFGLDKLKNMVGKIPGRLPRVKRAFGKLGDLAMKPVKFLGRGFGFGGNSESSGENRGLFGLNYSSPKEFISSLFGKVSNKFSSKKEKPTDEKILDSINSILKHIESAFPIKDSEQIAADRVNGVNDIIARRKAAEKKKQEEEGTEGENGTKKKGFLAGLFASKKKEEGDEDEEDSPGLAEAMLGYLGLKKAGGLVGKVLGAGKNLLGKGFGGIAAKLGGMGLMAKVGSMLPSLGTAATAATTASGIASAAGAAAPVAIAAEAGAAGVAGGGLLASAGTVAAGIGTAMLGLSNPVGWAILAGSAIMAGYSAYNIYKVHKQKAKLKPLELLRFLQYGIPVDNANAVSTIRYLEDEIKDKIEISKDGTPTLGFEPEDLYSDFYKEFGCDFDNKQDYKNFSMWFYRRFLPVYIKHKVVAEVLGKCKLADADDKLPNSIKYKYVNEVQFGLKENKADIIPYQITSSPWKDIALSDNESHIKTLSEQIKNLCDRGLDVSADNLSELKIIPPKLGPRKEPSAANLSADYDKLNRQDSDKAAGGEEKTFFDKAGDWSQKNLITPVSMGIEAAVEGGKKLYAAGKQGYDAAIDWTSRKVIEPLAKTGKSFNDQAGNLLKRLKQDFNLTDIQAAGIVGNLGHESAGLKAGIQEGGVKKGRGGLGWAQWTGPRRVAFEKLSQQTGMPVTDPELNYKMLYNELSGPYKGVVDRLRKVDDSVEKAVYVFERGFEVSGDVDKAGNIVKPAQYNSRYKYANAALALATGKSSGTGKSAILTDSRDKYKANLQAGMNKEDAFQKAVSSTPGSIDSAMPIENTTPKPVQTASAPAPVGTAAPSMPNPIAASTDTPTAIKNPIAMAQAEPNLPNNVIDKALTTPSATPMSPLDLSPIVDAHSNIGKIASAQRDAHLAEQQRTNELLTKMLTAAKSPAAEPATKQTNNTTIVAANKPQPTTITPPVNLNRKMS